MLACQHDEFLGLASIGGECLLAYHCLAVLNGQACVGIVVRVWRGYIHDVDLRVTHQFLITAIGLDKAITLGKLLCSSKVARRYGVEHVAPALA